MSLTSTDSTDGLTTASSHISTMLIIDNRFLLCKSVLNKVCFQCISPGCVRSEFQEKRTKQSHEQATKYYNSVTYNVSKLQVTAKESNWQNIHFHNVLGRGYRTCGYRKSCYISTDHAPKG